MPVTGVYQSARRVKKVCSGTPFWPRDSWSQVRSQGGDLELVIRLHDIILEIAGRKPGRSPAIMTLGPGSRLPRLRPVAAGQTIILR